jgi:hypothetical protein
VARCGLACCRFSLAEGEVLVDAAAEPEGVGASSSVGVAGGLGRGDGSGETSGSASAW